MKPQKQLLDDIFHEHLEAKLSACVRAREHAAYLALAEFIRGRVNTWITWAAKHRKPLDPRQLDQLWQDIASHDAFHQISRSDREGALKVLFNSIRRQLFLGTIEASSINPVASGKEVFIEPPFPPPEIEGDSDLVMIWADDDAGVIVGRAKRIPLTTIQAVFAREPGEEDPKKWTIVKGHQPDSHVFGHHAPRRGQDYDLEFIVLYHSVDGQSHLSPPTRISVVHEPPVDAPGEVVEELVFVDSPPPDPRAVVDDDLKGRWFRKE